MKWLGGFILLIVVFGAGVGVQKYILKENSGGIGILLGLTGHGDMENSSGDSGASKEPQYWVAPMDANYRRDKPGKSPMGMDLVPVYAEEMQSNDEGAVKISPVVMNNLGVRTAPVTVGKIDLPINTIGFVDFDEDKLIHLHSRVDGWIEVLKVTSSGDPVKKGQTLYELYSPALVNAQEEFLAAVRSGNALMKNASSSRLLSLGLNKQQIARLEKRRKVDQRIKVLAPTNGFVKDLNVREGMFIKPATEVLSLGSLATVWIIAEVFERQASWVKPGLQVEIQTEALPGRRWKGTVDYIYPVLDSKTRTLRIRVKIENKDHSLKPNMFADLTIYGLVSEEAISIPREALIKGGRYHRVVKDLGNGEFKSVIVKTGIEAGKQIQILEGLTEGDRVVTSAQFLIDSESNIDAELARMEARENGGSMAETEGKQNTSEITSNRVKATGEINMIMLEDATLNVSHDPIKAWDWPSMKMDFQVADSVDLKKLEKGQQIEFVLEKQGEWDYLITSVAASSLEKEPMNNTGESVESVGKVVSATGQVKQLMTGMDMIMVVHDPIPEWEWPSMNMSFSLAEPEKLPKLKPGDKIRFQLEETEDGDYLISKIKKRNHQ